MRAVVLTTYGGPERLSVSEIPEPAAPDPDGVLIRTAAAAVNPVDLQTRAGLHAGHSACHPPMVLGWDLAGTVTAVGGAVTGFRVGDRVVAMSAQMATGRGTYAEVVALPADIVAHAPASVPRTVAAGLPLAGLTARQALGLLALPEGSSVLVTGAVGSVGGLAVQLARLRGLTVVAQVRSARDEDHARALGADRVVDAAHLPVAGVDGLLETAGLPEAIGAVRDGGRVVTVVPRRVPAAERGVHVAVSHVEQDGRGLSELSALVDAGELRLRAAREFGFEEAAEAHRRLAAGGVRGKLLLLP
ncbi:MULTISPECIES: NADP-dependent oxidoreductase [Streptomyces]|uniref:NADP-dependent oxidoreductase n=1 Tax=Streptomyces chilikensis TaxID=1194079 RepID=A0ABV3EHN6_9ACTN|nr:MULTISPECIES: NADP-dependent oxidoreductase [Streptomyces]MDH6228329.1 NADPH2:quinone reductase [Streptomyces sp. MJP52]